MIYELKTYRAAAGKREPLVQRFVDHAKPAIERLGGRVIGGWLAQDDADVFVYVVEFAGDAARKALWEGFAQDAGWKAAKAASEKDGPLLAEQRTQVLLSFPGWPGSAAKPT